MFRIAGLVPAHCNGRRLATLFQSEGALLEHHAEGVVDDVLRPILVHPATSSTHL